MDFDAFLVNSTGHPVRVTGAHLAVLSGQKSPALLHLGLEHGRNEVGVQAGWPPSDVGATPLIGHSLPAGLDKIAVGIGSDEPGVYMVTGVTLHLKNGGMTGAAQAFGGAIVCVYRTAAQHKHCTVVMKDTHYDNLLLSYLNAQ